MIMLLLRPSISVLSAILKSESVKVREKIIKSGEEC